MRLVLVSDTHLPKRAKDLPPALWHAIEAADVVIHAGDWVSLDHLDELEARAKRVIGCYGNNDGPDLRARLPEVNRVELEGCGSASSTRRVRRRVANYAASGPIPISTCWFSGTATSRGTRRRLAVSACSTRGRRPTAVASPTTPT